MRSEGLQCLNIGIVWDFCMLQNILVVCAHSLAPLNIKQSSLLMFFFLILMLWERCEKAILFNFSEGRAQGNSNKED